MVIGAVSSVASVVQAQRAANTQERQQQVATRRSQRQAIRQAMIQRSQTIAAGASMGALGGSSLQGGVSSLGSQLGEQLGFSTEMSGLSRKISHLQSSSQMLGSLGGLLMQGGRQFAAGSSPDPNRPPTTSSTSIVY